MVLSNMTRANVVAVPQPRMGRKIRRPVHTFQLRQRPFQIQPFMIAPVLPGETLKSGIMQARAITDPIKNRHIGWWGEYYWYYVKLRDLDDRAEIEQMILDTTWTRANIDSETAVVRHYFMADTGKGQVDWVAKCLKRVTEEFFRDEGETWNTAHLDNIPLARITQPAGIWQSALPAASVVFEDVVVSTAGDDFTMGEFDNARRTYEILRQSFSVEMTFEEYLRMSGVRAPLREEIHRPEEIRYVRNWQYPVSAIDPTDGSAASAVQWSTAERIDKDRYFSEPGFVFGVTVFRPKVYLSGQKGNASQVMDSLLAWLPTIMNDDPNSSLKNLPDNTGILGDITDAGGAWVDVKDLLLYGDQFVNFALTETDANFVALPTVGMAKHYPSSTDVDNLFSAASPANQVRQDGICTLNIAGRQVETSA